jgi:large subunit ribosomal protein L19
MNLLQYAQEQLIAKTNAPKFKAGDTITVNYKIKEGEKERIQQFTGVVLQLHGDLHVRTFTVRKISNGVGVERIFPLHSPFIESIKVDRRGEVRRAKLFYLRDAIGKKAKIDELKEDVTKKSAVAVA